MTNNGHGQEILSATLKDGTITVNFNHDINMAVISHAMRLTNLELDNAIIAMQTKKKSNIEVSQNVIDRMTKGM